MSNKIQGLESRPVQVGTDRSVQRKGDAGAEATVKVETGTGSGDGVHITGSARQLAAIEQTLKDLPVVDEARVEQLRSAIEAGTYKVDAARIADKMLLLEDQLGSALPRK